jgi:hypothetical protein
MRFLAFFDLEVSAEQKALWDRFEKTPKKKLKFEKTGRGTEKTRQV